MPFEASQPRRPAALPSQHVGRRTSPLDRDPDPAVRRGVRHHRHPGRGRIDVRRHRPRADDYGRRNRSVRSRRSSGADRRSDIAHEHRHGRRGVHRGRGLDARPSVDVRRPTDRRAHSARARPRHIRPVTNRPTADRPTAAHIGPAGHARPNTSCIGSNTGRIGPNPHPSGPHPGRIGPNAGGHRPGAVGPGTGRLGSPAGGVGPGTGRVGPPAGGVGPGAGNGSGGDERPRSGGVGPGPARLFTGRVGSVADVGSGGGDRPLTGRRGSADDD
jgi:hypothetical protein